MTITNDLIGKRCLLKINKNRYYKPSNIEEFKIIEISPSQNFIKLLSIYGNKFWTPIAETSLIEVLKDLEKRPQEV